MAADGGRVRRAQAAQACMICKNRKKKCNKSLPSCGYCTRKDLDCVYVQVPNGKNHAPSAIENGCSPLVRGARPPMNVHSRMVLSAKLPSDQTTDEVDQLSCPFAILSKTRSLTVDCQVYLEVHGIIRGTRQFVDDISARYFQGFHPHLPIISRTRFYDNLITLGAAPAADFSILLLTICLITYAPALGYRPGDGATPSIEQQSLYLTARSLFAQVQVSCSSSVPLIQASLLLAVYEYTNGRPDDAFVTIASSARMAYAARIYTGESHQTHLAHTIRHNEDRELLLQAEEAANTWWGIIICERTFFCEEAVSDQPLVTIFPGGDSQLPIEPQVLDQLDVLDPQSLPKIPLSCLTSPKVGGFGRTAQAACLLDQVLKGFDIPEINSRLLLLDRLDTNIQAFLSLVIPQCPGQAGVFCAAINIAIRSPAPQIVRANFKPLEDWHKQSQQALDTVTKMVLDIAETLVTSSPANQGTQTIDGMPPIHIRSSAQRQDVGWLGSAEDVLRMSLDRYFQRWSVSVSAGWTCV
ncbi:hypothetical protein V8E51_015528 [Hyaloscypha variabilis]